jgi:nitroreductase
MKQEIHVLTLIDLVLSRRSIRRYKQTAIPPDVLQSIFEAGRQAPSAANRQPFRIIAVTDSRLRHGLANRVFSRFINDAPLTLVGCANSSAILTGKWAIVDTVIALQNMVIAAWAMGVGSCWVGAFKESTVKKLLKIPKKWTVVALVSLGYPDEQPKHRKKKALSQLVNYNVFED